MASLDIFSLLDRFVSTYMCENDATSNEIKYTSNGIQALLWNFLSQSPKHVAFMKVPVSDVRTEMVALSPGKPLRI